MRHNIGHSNAYIGDWDLSTGQQLSLVNNLAFKLGQALALEISPNKNASTPVLFNEA